jgi:hypothetical protein
MSVGVMNLVVTSDLTSVDVRLTSGLMSPDEGDEEGMSRTPLSSILAHTVTYHGHVAQAELLKLQKSGQFPDDALYFRILSSAGSFSDLYIPLF